MVHSDDGGGNESNNDGGAGGGEPDFTIEPGQNLDLTDPDDPVVEEDGEVVREPEPSGGDDDSDFGGDSGGDIQEQTNNNEDDSPNTTAVVVTENEEGEQVTVGQGTNTQEARVDAALNPDFDAAAGEEVDAFETAADTGLGDGTGPDALADNTQQETRQQETNTRNQQENRQTNPRLFQDAQETFIRSQQPNFQATPSGNTRTATTSELLNQGTQENIGQILREQTRPAREAADLRDQPNQKNFVTGGQINADLTPTNPVNIQEVGQEQIGGTNIQGRSFLNNRPRDFDNTVDLEAGETGVQTKRNVENIVGNEQFAESAGVAAAAGTQLVEGVLNIPAFSERLVNNPIQTGEATRKSIKQTVDTTGERNNLNTAQDFRQEAEEASLLTGAVATPLAGVASGGTVTGITNTGGALQAAKRASGVQDVQTAKQLITRDPKTGELVINQPGPTQVEKIDNRDLIETDQENLPQLSGNLRDEPSRRGAGPVDRPEEGLTRQEVEVLADERDVGQLGVRKEGPEGGIKEARTQDQQKRIVSDAEVTPASKARRLADKTEEIVGSLGKERKGSLQVTKQDTTGRDFDQPADTTNIDQRRPSRTRNDRQSLEEVVDDFEQSRRDRADSRQNRDSDVVDFTGQSLRNVVAASQGTAQTQNPIQDFNQDQDQRPGQRERQPQDQDRAQQPRQRQEPGRNQPDNVFNQSFDIPDRRRDQDRTRRENRDDRDFDIDFGRENNDPEKIVGFSDEPEVTEAPEAAPSVDAILFGETGEEDKDDEEVFSGFETRQLDPGNEFDLV